MSKGLKQTLMTVAIAMIGVQAMAMAPVIQDIKSPIVGSADMVTGTGKFVYPDAINLGSVASDDVTATSALKWTYEIVGTPIYQINGKDPINSASEDPTTPPDAKVINAAVATGETNPDGKAYTITVRNKHLSPLGGSDTTPAATGIVAAETQLVTFYCSDGNAYSSKTVFFYTDNGGSDRLSGGSKKTLVKKDTIAQQWDWATGEMKLGTCNKAAWNAQGGISLEVSDAGANYGSVGTAFGYLQLAANKVYNLRAKMNGSQTTVGHTPMWDLSIANYDGATKGKNAYGFMSLYFDNVGGANAILSSANGTWIDMFWAPAPVATTQWAGFFSNAAYQNDRDARITFRVNDIGTNASGQPNGTQAEAKGGKIAIQELEIYTADLSAMTVKSTPINLTNLVNVGTTGANVHAYGLVGTTVAFSGGAVTLTPTGAGQTAELASVIPATTANADPDAVVADRWPLAWTSNKLYQIEYGLAAPNATGESTPPDVLYFDMHPPTWELIQESWVSNQADRVAMPKQGAAQKYMTFFYTQNAGALSSPAVYKNLRWRFRLANTDKLLPNPNTGGVTLSYVKVNEVSFD